MSLAPERALAAARTRLLAERLPLEQRDELLEAWGATLDAMEEARSVGAAELVLLLYRQRVEERLARAALRAHQPLEEVPR